MKIGIRRQPSTSAPLRVVGPTRLWLRVCSVLVGVLVVLLMYSVFTNPRFEWGTVVSYLFAPPVLAGVGKTLMLTAIAMVSGIVLGVPLAVFRLSSNPILSNFALAYIWFFRGTPLLVQLLFWYFISALYPQLYIGIPGIGPHIAIDMNMLITPFTAACLGLGLNEGAYMSEIIRSGIISLPRGQMLAAQSIGMTRAQAMRRIILPQAMRVIIPPAGNESIAMLKFTAMCIVIGYQELLTSVSIIYSRTFQTIPLLIVAAIWYLAITAIMSLAQWRIETHFNKGYGYRRQTRRASEKDRAPRSDAMPGILTVPNVNAGRARDE